MASAVWIRWSAIAASAAALAIYATWFLAGAALPFEILGGSRESPLLQVFGQFTRLSPVAGGALLYLAAITGTAAALLSLNLLTRGSALAAARHLGNAMGWAALCVVYLFFVSATPPFVAYLPESLVGLLLCDLGGFVLLAFSSAAFVQFWVVYPRQVPAEERAAFATMLQEKELGKLPARMRWLIEQSKRMDRMFGIDSSRSRVQAHTMRAYLRVVDGGVLCFLLIFSVVIVPFWRAALIVPASYSDLLSICWVIGLNALIMPTFICMFFTIDNIKLHRALGSVAERKSVEWVRAGMMINYVAIMLTVGAMALMAFSIMLLHLFFPQIASQLILQFKAEWPLLTWLGWSAFFSFGTAPLILILSLAASILYRGTLDPRLVVGRFTLWSVLGLLLTFIFVLIERAVAMKLVEWFDFPPQTGLIAAGAVVAATFQPIRKFTEKWAAAWTARLMPTSILAGGTRHEGAVAVVDISGYTALSAKDEQSALLATALVQKESRRVAESHEGRFVKSTGDGAILRFHTADEAMRAIRELHGAVDRGAATLSIADLKLHSGLNWGEFVEARDGDIYGQTVNIAARIADRAQAGEIATSAVFAAKLTLSDLSMKSMGPQRFKNVPEAIECHLLAVG